MAEVRSRAVFNYDFSPEEDFTEDDFGAADILLELSQIVEQRDPKPKQPKRSLLPFVWDWRVRKRRSALNGRDPSLPPPSPPVPQPPPFSLRGEDRSALKARPLIESPPQQASPRIVFKKRKRSEEEEEEDDPEAEPSQQFIRREGKTAVNGGEASSPETPLSFSPSESDYRSKHSKRKSLKKKSYEELKEVSTQLITQNSQLENEVTKVREHLEGLKAKNLALKNYRRQLEVTLSNPSRGLEPLDTHHHHQQHHQHQQQQQQHQQMSMKAYQPHFLPIEARRMYERPQQCPYNQNQIHYSNGVNGGGAMMKRRGVPDFSFNGVEDQKMIDLYHHHHQQQQQFDLRRKNKASDVTAQARKRRYEINKERKVIKQTF